jgi:hypothetical protein
MMAANTRDVKRLFHWAAAVFTYPTGMAVGLACRIGGDNAWGVAAGLAVMAVAVWLFVPLFVPLATTAVLLDVAFSQEKAGEFRAPVYLTSGIKLLMPDKKP